MNDQKLIESLICMLAEPKNNQVDWKKKALEYAISRLQEPCEKCETSRKVAKCYQQATENWKARYYALEQACISDNLNRKPECGPTSTEWEKAFDSILRNMDLPHQLVERRIVLRFDPRRKPEPANEFTGKDWLWG